MNEEDKVLKTEESKLEKEEDDMLTESATTSKNAMKKKSTQGSSASKKQTTVETREEDSEPSPKKVKTAKVVEKSKNVEPAAARKEDEEEVAEEREEQSSDEKDVEDMVAATPNKGDDDEEKDKSPSAPGKVGASVNKETAESIERDALAMPPPRASTSSRRDSYNKNAYVMLDVNHQIVEPKDVIEYEYPQKSGDRWFLQEQIGELLGIKSFSRKYPSFTRRKVDSEEREFLERVHNVHQLLNPTSLRDMNAMRASEVHDLLQSEFGEIYMEYKKIVSNREREMHLAKAKEMEEIKKDSVKLAALREEALRDAVAFNRDLQQSRRNERKHFWDIQTNIVQSPRNKWLVMKPDATDPGRYPVALYSAQYQTYYKTFTPEELSRLPLGTVTDSAYLFTPYREPSPPPLNIAENDLKQLERDEADRIRLADARGTMTVRQALSSSSAPGRSTMPARVKQDPVSQPMMKIEPGRKCDLCDKAGNDMICCALCKIVYHTACIEMPERMAIVVKTFEWACVDCRICSICNLPDEEENSQAFCDHCDRGFHFKCVGLKTIPRGTWICQKYCSLEQLKSQSRRTSSGRR